jgi:hypothetical protein
MNILLNKMPLDRASPNTTFWCLEKVLWCQNVKYDFLLEEDNNFNINAFLSKRASYAQPAAHSLPVSKPCKIAHIHHIEITGHIICYWFYQAPFIQKWKPREIWSSAQ